MAGRPKISREAYGDIARLMAYAYDKRRAITFEFATEAQAVRTLQRINQYRILDRQAHDHLMSVYDSWIYKRRGLEIIAEPRPPIPCIAMRDADGKEIPLAEIEKVYEVDEEAFGKSMAAAQKQFDEMQARKAAGNLERARERDDPTRDHLREIDPTKPLGLDEE